LWITIKFNFINFITKSVPAKKKKNDPFDKFWHIANYDSDYDCIYVLGYTAGGGGKQQLESAFSCVRDYDIVAATTILSISTSQTAAV